MAQKLYDDKYVNVVGVISAAKTNGLDMHKVQDKLDASGFDQDKLWAWKNWVTTTIRKDNPNFVDYVSLQKLLTQLDGWNDELQTSLNKAKRNKTMRDWEKEALKALKAAKKTAQERYG